MHARHNQNIKKKEKKLPQLDCRIPLRAHHFLYYVRGLCVLALLFLPAPGIQERSKVRGERKCHTFKMSPGKQNKKVYADHLGNFMKQEA
jgi:hypothetical protein